MSANAEVIHYARQYDRLTRHERTGCGIEVERDTVSSPDGSEVTCPPCLKGLGLEPKPQPVTHYAASVADDALCGAEWSGDFDVSALKKATTCPACLADLAEIEAPAIACSSMHEHDEVACAAPSVAEMTLEAVGSQLADLYARIAGVFEDEDASADFALSQVADRLGDLLKQLRVPVPAAAFVPSSVCPVCEAKLTFGRWGTHSEAWVADQVRRHIEGHESAPAGAE